MGFPAWTRSLSSIIAAVSAAIAGSGTYVLRAGDTMTGQLTINGPGDGVRIQSSSGQLRFGTGADVGIARPSTGVMAVTGVWELASYATGSLPALAAGNAGALAHNSTTNKLVWWNGTAWETITSA